MTLGGLYFEFAAVLLGCGLASFSMLLLFSKILPADFLKANMRGQSDGAVPVRQLGGLGICPVLILTILYVGEKYDDAPNTALICLALAIVWIVGALDDWRHLPVVPRLAAQIVAALMVVISFGPGIEILPPVFPDLIQKTIAFGFLIWFMNIANFMDGADMMSVAGLGVPALLVGLLLAAYQIGGIPLMLAAAISGSLFGFLPFNTPSARLYLGDSGSLVLGLAAGILSMQLAARTNILIALLPFAYYHLDAGITLLRRLLNGENILVAHTSHFYQRAGRSGISASKIALAVCLLNLALIGITFGIMALL